MNNLRILDKLENMSVSDFQNLLEKYSFFNDLNNNLDGAIEELIILISDEEYLKDEKR